MGPEAKRIMYENEGGGNKHKPQANKAVLLTSKHLKADPTLQIATARRIKDMPYEQAQTYVKAVNSGEIDPRTPLDRLEGIHYETSTKPPKYPEVHGDAVLEGIERSIALITYLTSKKHPDYTEELLDETRDFRLDQVKAFLISYDLIQTLEKYRDHLRFLQLLIRDMIPILQNEIEGKKGTEELLKR